MEQFNNEEAKKALKNRASKISEKDIQKVLNKKQEIEEKFKGNILSKYIDDVKLFFSLIKDYWNKEYRELPFYSIAAIVATLLYVLSPIDLIPDFIPVVGLLDDAAVIAICLNLVGMDIDNYRKWKMN